MVILNNQLIRGKDIPDDQILNQLGFRGMRKFEIMKFIKPFVEKKAIDAIDEDMPKDNMLPILEHWLNEGRFGPDPFGNLKAGDNVKAMQESLEAQTQRANASDERASDLEAKFAAQALELAEIKAMLKPKVGRPPKE